MRGLLTHEWVLFQHWHDCHGLQVPLNDLPLGAAISGPANHNLSPRSAALFELRG